MDQWQIQSMMQACLTVRCACSESWYCSCTCIHHLGLNVCFDEYNSPDSLQAHLIVRCAWNLLSITAWLCKQRYMLMYVTMPALPCNCSNSLLHQEPGEEHPPEVSLYTRQITTYNINTKQMSEVN